MYEIDLKGNVIKKSEDVNSKTYTDIEKSKKHFVTSDNEYFLKIISGDIKLLIKTKMFYMKPVPKNLQLNYYLSCLFL